MDQLLLSTISEDKLKTLITESIADFFIKNPITVQDNEDEIGNIELAVSITGLKKSTIYGLVSKRLIPHSKPSKYLYFSRQQLLKWIEHSKRKTVAEIISDK